MSRTTEIAVVIPCFNAEKHIAATLQSVRRQTFQDWQAIIVDDGSSDRSAAIARLACEEDDRFVYVHRDNAGVSAARNKGIALTDSRFIAFLDADDIWHADYLATLHRFIVADDTREIVFARTRIVAENGRPTGALGSKKQGGFTTIDLLCGNPTTTTSNLFVDRKVFDSVGLFQVGLNHAEDQLWLLQAHLAGHKLKGTDEVLLDYRTNQAGLSADLEAMRLGWERLIETACRSHRAQIEPLIAHARARNLRYLARRALRVKPGSGDAWCYLLCSIRNDCHQLARQPWPVWPLAAVCALDAVRQLLPGTATPHQKELSSCQKSL